MTIVDTVIAELAQNRLAAARPEPLIADNFHMQEALTLLQAGSVPQTMPDGTILSNISGVVGPPLSNTLSATIDHDIGATQGMILFRGSAGWNALAPATPGELLQNNGAGNNPTWSTLGQITGEPGAGSAFTGNIGEYVSSTVAVGSAIPLATNVASVITSISLTPGDWDVTGAVNMIAGTGTLLFELIAAISLTTANIPTTSPGQVTDVSGGGASQNGNNVAIPVGPIRFSLSATTTVFLNAEAGFLSSTLSAYGMIRARRMR